MKQKLFAIVITILILIPASLSAQSNYISVGGTQGTGDIYHLFGGIGIGTDNPNNLLHLKGKEEGNSVSFRLEIPGNILVAPSIWDIENNGSLNFKYGTNLTETKVSFSGSGTITATKFIGDGSGLTDLPLPWTKTGDDIYYLDGNVSIGTTIPTSRFEVYNSHPSNWSAFIQNQHPSGDGKGLRVKSGISTRSDQPILQLEDLSANVRFKVMSNGNVGIGSTNPTAKLCVAGNITAEEVLISLDEWKDEVFNKDYSFLTLYELEDYINSNGHLPDIPSENEMIENGMETSEIIKLQMQKIEELTLYIIELNKRIENLEKN